MKKPTLGFILALAFTTFGAPEKVATVQLADTETLVEGVSKLGEFTGNQMLGIMVSQFVTKLPWIEAFGMGRPGAATTFIVYMDGDEPTGAILYPATITAAEFKQKYPKAVEKDGLVYLAEAEDVDEDDDEDMCDEPSDNLFLSDDLYVGFSADGKWLAASDEAALTKSALDEVKSAERKLDGELLKIVVPTKGIRKLEKCIEKELAKGKGADAEKMRDFAAVLKQFSMYGMGIRVNDSGLDLRGVFKPTEGSDLAKIGLTPISADAWQTIDPAAVLFGLYAANSGKQDVPLAALKAVFEKYGIKMDFLAEKVVKKGYSTLTVDVPAVVAYCKDSTNCLELAQSKALFEALGSLVNQNLPQGQFFPLTNEPFGDSLVLKGFTPIANAKDRFEATLPEVKAKPCSNVGFLSLYSVFKALRPTILENIDKDARTMLEPMFLALPPEGKTGIAWAQWQEKGATRFIIRIGADEFKSVSAGFAAFSMMQMQKMQQAMGGGMDDDDSLPVVEE